MFCWCVRVCVCVCVCVYVGEMLGPQEVLDVSVVCIHESVCARLCALASVCMCEVPPHILPQELLVRALLLEPVRGGCVLLVCACVCMWGRCLVINRPWMCPKCASHP